MKRDSRGDWVADWVDFAAVLMVLSGSFDIFQGLIALIRSRYYSFTPAQVLLFDLRTWGWILLFWGVLVALTGFGLWSRSTVARWAAIVFASLNLMAELVFAGNNDFPLWAFFSTALAVVVIYALLVRWDAADSA